MAEQFRFPGLAREQTGPAIRVDEREGEAFRDFVSHMLCWKPGDRVTARSLLAHPWLGEREQGHE